MKKIIFLLFLTSWPQIKAQTATEIVNKSDKIARGTTSYAEVKITVVRPKWSKDMNLKIWSKGADYSVSLVTSPAKEKGSVFLKRKTEVWNYIPSIERTIKLPPSMMMQNWMGTDMTNDDLVKQSSIVVDYTHKIIGTEKVIGLDCWKLELTPKEDAAVVWGKIIMWIDKTDYMQLKIEFYDEDAFLVNKLIAYHPKKFGNRTLPSKIEYIPVDKKGQKTVIEYLVWKFDLSIPDTYFTSNYMKRLR
ncbi:MAG TPA: outer membrane lipoprotein-sorting protein [Flavobacteriia bacterium]|nr:outer membrane lipoprotein-sorting protein [Flavobacteriia bacterium]